MTTLDHRQQQNSSGAYRALAGTGATCGGTVTLISHVPGGAPVLVDKLIAPRCGA